MKKIVRTVPSCSSCGGQLVINELIVDMVNCAYILDVECIMCGRREILHLSLTDFIDLTRLLLGGSDETS